MANPNFTPDEQAFINQVLAIADPNKLGIVPGDVAVNLFAGSDIPADTLGDIWQIADSENNGFLTRKGLGIALRLMSHVQFGETVAESLVHKPAPPPTIKGITPLPVKPSTPVSTQRSVPATPTPRPVPPIPARPSTVYAPSLPPLTAEDRAKFTRIFAQSGPVAGLLSGEKARDVFLKSRLPVDTLAQIWALADTQSRGALDLTDFILGMYFIQSIMNKSLPTLPATVPAELYEQASGGRTRVASPAPISPISRQTTGSQPVVAHTTGGSFQGAPSPSPVLASHVPSANPTAGQRIGSITRMAPLSTGSTIASPWVTQPQPSPASTWDITSAEKATYDQFFASLDKTNAGFITGDIAVPFMLESKLPESTLAHIWDLADIDNTGQLDRDGFAVAMHLINGQLAGKELPSTLPPSLVPPSKRVAATQPAQSRPADDLFSLFDDQPAVQPPVPAQASSPTNRPPPVGTASRAGATSATIAPQHLPDLLGDDDIAESAPQLPDRSVEVGNLQNQLASTQRSVEKSKAEREPLEKQVADYAAQIAQLESQLAAAKAAHDAETQLLSNVRTRSAEQAEQIRKLKEELIRAESDLSALRLEKTEIETALLRDKEDVRDMQKKMKAIGDDTEKVKAELEKVKTDARLQKGLVAIAKKQLATAEAERAKILEALEAAHTEVEEAKRQAKEAEEAAAGVLASIPEPSPPRPVAPEARSADRALSPSLEKPMAIPLPETPEPGAAPSITSSKSNNPFDRLTRGMSSGVSTPRSLTSALPASSTVPSAAENTRPSSAGGVTPTSGLLLADANPLTTSNPPSAEAAEDPFRPGDAAPKSSTTGSANTFDDIFGPDKVGGMESTPNVAVQPAEQTPTSEGNQERVQDPLQDVSDDNDDALQHAEVQFPPIEGRSGAQEDLPPLHELEAADDDSSEDDFKSAPQTAHSAIVSTSPVTDAAGGPAPVGENSAPSKDSLSAGEDGTPRTPMRPDIPEAGMTLSSPSLAPPLDDDFFETASAPTSDTVDVSAGRSAALNDFDEALGQMPASATTANVFQFDSAFGDRPAASPSRPVHAPVNGTAGSGSGQVNGGAASFGPVSMGPVDDFDGLLPEGGGMNGSALTQSSTAPSLSFDDAFVVAPVPISTPTPVQPPRPEGTRNIFAANMPSPRTSRKISSKNKGLILNPNMPAVFHSELAPPPTQRTEGATTPALPDDVDAVKQLCNMGFTRSQAVEALEKYGYDVSKALNSLLR